MPLEFTDEPYEPRDSSRKRLIVGATAAIIGAALIGAAGVFATIALLNAFAADTAGDIRDHLTCQRFDVGDREDAPDDLVEAIKGFRSEYGVPFMPTVVTVDDRGDVVIAELTPARDDGEWVILAPSTEIDHDADPPGEYRGYRVQTCMPAAGRIPDVDEP